MKVFNRYPYTDLHELNLDFILAQMKDLQSKIDGLLQEAIDQATANAKAYLDSQIDDIMRQFNELQTSVNNLRSDYTRDFTELTRIVNAFVTNFTAEMNALKKYVDDALTAQALQMQLLISQNNEYLLAEMETYLAQIKVINYFTGEKISIQDMFNYLAQLHLNDSIDYNTMAYRAKTYSQLAALNINYTNLAMHGNTLYV
jgi:hypothetical protein